MSAEPEGSGEICFAEFSAENPSGLPPLAVQMLKLAETHPRADELRQRADDFVARSAPDALASDGGVKRMMGAWARARLLWCEITGEALV